MTEADTPLVTTLPQGASSQFRPDIQGLRAVAIALVVLFHFQLGPFKGGQVGVDVFFVISGYVITTALLRERDRSGKFSISGFYSRRVLRILPASTLVLLSVLVASIVMFSSSQVVSVAADARAAALFFANVHVSHSANAYYEATKLYTPLGHYWSLSIEEQFYMLWPITLLGLLALVVQRWQNSTIAVGLAALTTIAMGVSIVATPSNRNAAYFSSFIRFGEIALGALVAVAESWRPKIPRPGAEALTWIGLVAIFAASVAFRDAASLPGWRVIIPIVATSMLIRFAPLSYGSTTWLLSRKPMLWLGAISYSLYLWHYPIYVLAVDHGHSWPSTTLASLLLATSVLVAAATYRFIENPARRSVHLRNHVGRTFALGGTLIASVIGLSYAAPSLAG
jgi:peptidoglycan/LPS O-acetylase OafA/YrhL